MPNVGDGGILGYSTLISVVCEECGLGGSPLVFDDEAEYQKFRAEVSEGAHDAVEEADAEEGTAAEAEAEEQERAALGPKERAFLEDAQKAGEPKRPTVTVVALTLFAIALMVTTGAVTWGYINDRRTTQSQWEMTAVFAVGVALQILIVWAYLRVARRMWVKATMG